MTTASKTVENHQIEPCLTVVSNYESEPMATDELEVALSWPTLELAACPLGIGANGKGHVQQVGPYNPQALAGKALCLTAALSPDYLNAYLAGLNDLAQLNGLDRRE